eukprot:1145084-Pelagomonas_calceolata.AAC.1
MAHTQLMGLSNAGSCFGSVWGAVPAVLHGVRRRRRKKKKEWANQANNSVADNGIPGAGPSGFPFSHTFWSAKEGKRGHAADTSTTPAPSPKTT